MPSSINLIPHDEDILDAYDLAFEPDPRLSPLINSLPSQDKDLFFAFLRICCGIDNSEFRTYSFSKQNFSYEFYLESVEEGYYEP